VSELGNSQLALGKEMTLSKNKSAVKSSTCLVKVKLSTFGPVIVQEIWRGDGIFRVSSISSQAHTLVTGESGLAYPDT
jgi:hypothetical protein